MSIFMKECDVLAKFCQKYGKTNKNLNFFKNDSRKTRKRGARQEQNKVVVLVFADQWLLLWNGKTFGPKSGKEYYSTGLSLFFLL